MRLSDRLKAQLLAALQERAKAGVQIRICYDGDKPLRAESRGRPGSGAAGHGRDGALVRLSLSQHRRDEIDA